MHSNIPFRPLVVRVYLVGALLSALAACQRAVPPAAAPQANGSGEQVSSADALLSAEAAWMRHDFPAAEEAYRGVLAADTSTEHRVSAAASLANIAWRIRRDSAAAQDFLTIASSIDPRDLAVPRQRARMRTALGNFAGARIAAEQALALASEPREEARAVSLLASAVIEPILLRLELVRKLLDLMEMAPDLGLTNPRTLARAASGRAGLTLGV